MFLMPEERVTDSNPMAGPQQARPAAGIARALWFTAARTAEILEQPVTPPGPGQVMVRAIVSLVSSGTELLIYRGEGAGELGLETCEGSFKFPVKYAYQVVGEVVAAGPGSSYAPGQIVFARHPHQSLFTMNSESALITGVPHEMDPDCVVVFGQGTVGSLAAQLARRTAGTVVAVDPLPGRRERALSWGADLAVAPDDAAEAVAAASSGRGADIAIEASGTGAALQAAINVTGQEGTIVAVSFFGNKVIPLVLAPEFHYRRQRIISSQVSTLGAGLQPRWSLGRRDRVAFSLLAEDWLQTPVTHRLPFAAAPEAYRLLDRHPDEAIGVLLDYRE